MNTGRGTQRVAGGLLAALCMSVFSCFDYEVPITSDPTRNVDDRLLGDWVCGSDTMRVRRLNNSTYICIFNGDLVQAFHSDVGKNSFISAQDIESDERKYAYLTYRISDDGDRLAVRFVNEKVIPVETKDSATIRKLLEDNLQNPSLFEEEDEFTRVK